MSRRHERVSSSAPESVLRAAASQPWRRSYLSPNDLFYADPAPTPARTRPTTTTERAGARRDERDARLITRAGIGRECPRCGSPRISWDVRDDGRALGKCFECGAAGSPDTLLQGGPRVSPILYAIKAAARRVALGILERHSLPIGNAVRVRAKDDPVLAAALDDLEVVLSARLHVLGRHNDPAIDPLKIPLTLDFVRFRPGRPRISRHEARRRIRALLEAKVIRRAATKGGHSALLPVFELVRAWNARRASRRTGARGGAQGRVLPSVHTRTYRQPRAAALPPPTASGRAGPAARAGPRPCPVPVTAEPGVPAA